MLITKLIPPKLLTVPIEEPTCGFRFLDQDGFASQFGRFVAVASLRNDSFATHLPRVEETPIIGTTGADS